MRLRLFASAREAAGCASDTVEAASLGEALDLARARYGDGFAAVLARARVWINGDEPTHGDATALVDDDEVAVLPPVSGGCAEAVLAPPPLVCVGGSS
ncbi:MAG TPA: MoaD/ThiS family protein [Acidimicrobiia bacterium]|nr:MoaD/ThiS family protein [Acidimicrobiia bacterium]